MEAAGRAVAEAALEVATAGPARIVCGKGNNGGDGLVAARHLAAAGIEADALLLWPADELSGDARASLDRLEGGARHVEAAELEGALRGRASVVDAIFGTGFSGAPRAPADAAIAAIGACGAPVVAADIASGVDASTGEVAGGRGRRRHHGDVPRRQARPVDRPGQAPSRRAAGGGDRDPAGRPSRRRRRADRDGGARPRHPARAGLDEVHLGTGADRRRLARAHRRGLHGRGGGVARRRRLRDRGRPGEPRAHLRGQADRGDVDRLRGGGRAPGPGRGRRDPRGGRARRGGGPRARASAAATAPPSWSRELARRIEAPLLVDADGLNALAGSLEILAERSAPTVITPHAGELARLLETDDEVNAHRLANATEAAARSGAVVVLKGDDTIVAAPDRPPLVNGLASPALATAGTGDVLSGMTGAMLARGLEPRAAAARRRPRPHAGGPGRRRARRRRGVGDRHGRDRRDPGRPRGPSERRPSAPL